MLRLLTVFFITLLSSAFAVGAPLRVAIVGLAHGHVIGFLNGGSNLVPSGGALHRPDVEVVGIVEPRRELFDGYAQRLHLAPNLYFSSISEMASKVKPDAALVFTSTFGHTAAVLECAKLGIHVMMEKPMAVTYRDALAMADAARRHHVHVVVDYETTWYGSNKAAYDLMAENGLGEIRKVIVRDGHRGPKLIHVQPEFFEWLTDPKLNGAGALYDFGCYGADLMTWFMHGELPETVSAVTKQLQPDIYPKVDDEADVILNYKNAVAILQGSWSWAFDVKNMDVYGRTGYVKTLKTDHVEIRKEGDSEGSSEQVAAPAAPYDDPLHYLVALIHGEIQENKDLSSLETNVLVSEILDAARQSAQTGKAIHLPLSGK